MILQAVVYYTIFGGFLVLAVLGIIAGLIGWWLGRPESVDRYVRDIALGLAFAVAVILAVLDKVIGPW